MIPDWKLEKYLTGDLPIECMRELHELELTDEVFANRVKMYREDNNSILCKMPYEVLAKKIDAQSKEVIIGNRIVTFKMVKFVAAVLILAFVCVAVLIMHDVSLVDIGVEFPINQMAMAEVETGTRIKGMGVRMEIWKKTEKGIIQLDNLSEVHEGDEIQLRYSVPENCFGLLFSMDGNGTITIHVGNGNKSIALESSKMLTIPFAYKLDDAPKFEKFFLLTSKNEFELNVANIDEIFKKDGVESKSLTLRKVGGKN